MYQRYSAEKKDCSSPQREDVLKQSWLMTFHRIMTARFCSVAAMAECGNLNPSAEKNPRPCGLVFSWRSKYRYLHVVDSFARLGAHPESTAFHERKKVSFIYLFIEVIVFFRSLT